MKASKISPEQTRAIVLIRDTLSSFRQGPQGAVILSEYLDGVATTRQIQDAFDTLFSSGGLWYDETWEGGDERLVYWLMSEEQFRILLPEGSQKPPRKNYEPIVNAAIDWCQKNRLVRVPNVTFSKIIESADLESAKKLQQDQALCEMLFHEGGSFLPLLHTYREVGRLSNEQVIELMGFVQSQKNLALLFFQALIDALQRTQKGVESGKKIESVFLAASTRQIFSACDCATEHEHPADEDPFDSAGL